MQHAFPSPNGPCHLKGLQGGLEGTVALIARCMCEPTCSYGRSLQATPSSSASYGLRRIRFHALR